MKAVHFGAGNIGRGFVGLLLHEGGYELVFSDVAAPLVDAINAASEYTVHEVGEDSRDTVVTGFRAINSATHPDEVIEEIAGANVLTTAVGPTILKFVAPHVVAALALRDPSSPPLQIMACENAINATDLLRDEVAALAGDAWDALAGRAVFANTAVDRIVPAQPAGGGIDVTVEPFFEWAIERHPFGDDPPTIPGAHFVDDLAPYIERKLFTVNTGHAATAYFGAAAGDETIADALADEATAARVAATLEETSALLVAKHGSTRPSSPRIARRSCVASRTPLCRTPSGAWAGSPCASSAATSASSDRRPKRPNAACRWTRSWRRWGRPSRSRMPKTNSRCSCSSFCGSRMPRP